MDARLPIVAQPSMIPLSDETGLEILNFNILCTHSWKILLEYLAEHPVDFA